MQDASSPQCCALEVTLPLSGRVYPEQATEYRRASTGNARCSRMSKVFPRGQRRGEAVGGLGGRSVGLLGRVFPAAEGEGVLPGSK